MFQLPLYVYSVVDILTDTELYLGDSEALCARALEPGTTYGRGFTIDEARQNALDEAVRFRAQGYGRDSDVGFITDGRRTDCD